MDEDMVEPAPMVAVLPGGKAEGARGGVSAQLANLASSQLAADDLWRFLSRREAGEGGEDKAPTSREIQLDKLQWALEQGDAALAAFNCARLESGTPVPGVLLVCARSLYLFEHCSIEASGDVVGQPALAPTRAAVGEGSSVRRWAHRSIRDIQRRRYLLRPVGLEIFSDGKDCLLILSVGGGNLEKNVSPGFISAIQLAKQVGARVIGIVGKDGGYTAQQADACVIVPTVNPNNVTPHSEAFQAVIWHLWVSHPDVKVNQTKWESVTTAKA